MHIKIVNQKIIFFLTACVAAMEGNVSFACFSTKKKLYNVTNLRLIYTS